MDEWDSVLDTNLRSFYYLIKNLTINEKWE